MSHRAALLVVTLWACAYAGAQDTAASLYRQLGSLGLDSTRVYRIREAHIAREDIRLSLNSGVIAFTQSIDGRITGAVFEGDGDILLQPPDRVERTSLNHFTDAAILETPFSSAWLRFNDDTFNELQPYLRPVEAAPAAAEPDIPTEPDEELDAEADAAASSASTPQELLARWGVAARRLSASSALRLLTTFINAQTPSGWKPQPNDRFFMARLMGTRHGIFDVYFDSLAPEQIVVAQDRTLEGQSYYDVWTSFPMRSVRARVATLRASLQTQAAAEAFVDPVRLTRYEIKVRVQPPSGLQAEAALQVQTSVSGQRLLVFELSRSLRVKEVSLEGRALEFVQDEAKEGSDLDRRGNDLVAVVFPQALQPNVPLRLRFVYAGDVLSEAGGGLMYVGARGIWYPNRGLAMADFDMEFRYPAQWTLVATGKRISSETVQGEQVARYVSERPMPVAGFNLGLYHIAQAKTGNVQVETYAAKGVESDFPQQGTAVVTGERRDPFTGRRTPIIRVLPNPAPAPAQNAQKLAESTARTIDFLGTRLGPFPYSTLAITQMPGRTSQSWPGLIYLSSFSFVSPEERAWAQLRPADELVYGRLMPAHETAHQWWGDLLIWKSYREQWLVEALSNYCVLLMIEQEDPVAFRALMDQYRSDLLLETRERHRLGDAGPVTLGVRLNSSRFPSAYEAIAYGRGTWLFHMLRHMLLDADALAQRKAAAPDIRDQFFSVLLGLRQRFEGKEITTRDVEWAFEEALPESLRFEGQKSLEWFFDTWVNGSSIPSIELSQVKLTPRQGGVTAAGKILQKHAREDLVTSIPLYADTGAARPVLIARVFADGAETPFRVSAPAGTKKILVDPYGTVLRRP